MTRGRRGAIKEPLTRAISVAFFAAAAAALAACGGPRSQIAYPSFGDPSRFRSFGVLPFDGGDGARAAELLGAALERAGYGIVPPAAMEKLFKSLKLERAKELSLHNLADLRSASGADALVFGNVAPGRGELSLIVMDTELGEISMQARLRPRRPYAGPAEVAEAALAAIVRRPRSVGGVELPEAGR